MNMENMRSTLGGAALSALADFAEETGLEKLRGGKAELPLAEAMKLYDKHITRILDLMMAKNHDYGEAWRQMRIGSMVDLILMKLLRIKQIEDNDGRTLASEGVDGGYMDIVNYSLFSLVRLTEEGEGN